MKKLLLLLCAAMTIFITGCNVKTEVSAHVVFAVQADCKTQDDITKIENLIKSKGLPIGNTIVSVEGEYTSDIDVRVKQILADFLVKVSAAELNALNTGATVVYYRGTYVGFSSPVAIAEKTL